MMRVALPYYGNLIDPRQGLSKLFFIADVDSSSGKVTGMHLESRVQAAGQSFTNWLQKLLVNGVLSADQPDQCLAEFAEEGLWHESVPGGEPMDQITNCRQVKEMFSTRPETDSGR